MNWLQHRFALSRQGAKDLLKACGACTLSNLVLMLPVTMLYSLVADLLRGGVPAEHTALYVAGTVILLVLIALTTRLQYNATFLATYVESGVRRISLAEKLRRIPLSFFGRKDLAELTTTIMADCTSLEQSFSHFIPELAGAMVSTVLVAVGLFFMDARMALAALWPLPLSFLLVFSSGRVQDQLQEKQRAVQMRCADGIQECLESARDLKANNAEADYLKTLEGKIDALEKRSILTELGTAAFVATAQFLLKFGIATVALVGGVLLAKQEITVLMFFLFLLLASRLYDPMQSALINLAAILSTRVNINRMNEILEHPLQGGGTEFHPKSYDVAFDHVGFAYGNGEPVLKDVSFVARQGEVTALIGPSGGGKTTVSRLAARFWDCTRGNITVGGVNVKDVEPETLLSLYSIVFQEVTLFNNTVMENIRIGRKGATEEEVMCAARAAHCDGFIARLPKGWQTRIGENGAELSGGERQRISIARAFLKDAPILLLDEATASLDVDNESEIQQALSGLIRDKTVLLIAHRMRTVSGADQIVVLDNGTVSEQGSPAELDRQNGIYRRMAALQKNALA